MPAYSQKTADAIAKSGIPMSADSAPTSPGRAAREALAAYEKHPDIGFACCSAHTAADTVSALLAENERLRRELAARMEDIAFTDRNTLPELRRTIQHHEDGKKRWRDRAEKAEPERDALKQRVDAVLDLCDREQRNAMRWENPIPVPDWVEPVQRAALGDDKRAAGDAA